MRRFIVEAVAKAGCSLILVVEDHEDSRLAMVHVLERAGYSVTSAHDGRAALQVIEQTGIPDAIVLDLMMPVFTGWELLRVLRANEPLRSVPIIVVSAYYTPHRELGPVRFIPKPANFDTLLRAVAEVLGGSGSASGGSEPARGSQSGSSEPTTPTPGQITMKFA